MKKLLVFALLICGIAFAARGFTEDVGSFTMDRDTNRQSFGVPTNPVSGFASVTSVNSKTFTITSGGQYLCVQLNGSQDTAYLPTGVWTPMEIIMHLSTQLTGLGVFPRTYRDKNDNDKLQLFSVGNSDAIAVIDTLNTASVTCTTVSGTQSYWTGESITYQDSNPTIGNTSTIDTWSYTGWIQINTHTYTETASGNTGHKHYAQIVFPVIDRGSMSGYDTLVSVVVTWEESASAGSQATKHDTISYRLCDTNPMTTNWTVATSGTIISSNARYFQYMLKMASNDTNQSPMVDTITVVSTFYDVNGDSGFVAFNFDNSIHYSSFPNFNMAVGGTPISSGCPIPAKDTHYESFSVRKAMAGNTQVTPSETFTIISFTGRVQDYLFVFDGTTTDSCDLFVSTENCTFSFKGGENISASCLFIDKDPIFNITKKGNSTITIRYKVRGEY